MGEYPRGLPSQGWHLSRSAGTAEGWLASSLHMISMPWLQTGQKSRSHLKHSHNIAFATFCWSKQITRFIQKRNRFNLWMGEQHVQGWEEFGVLFESKLSQLFTHMLSLLSTHTQSTYTIQGPESDGWLLKIQVVAVPYVSWFTSLHSKINLFLILFLRPKLLPDFPSWFTLL